MYWLLTCALVTNNHSVLRRPEFMDTVLDGTLVGKPDKKSDPHPQPLPLKWHDWLE